MTAFDLDEPIAAFLRGDLSLPDLQAKLEGASAETLRSVLATLRAAGRITPLLHAMLLPREAPAPAPAPGGSHLRPGTLLDGGWTVDAVIGEGGIATVYAAVDPQGQAKAAVKLVHPERVGGPEEAAALLDREAALLERLASPHLPSRHVPAVLGRGSLDGLSYLVLERLEGRTAKALLAERHAGLAPAPTPRQALRLLRRAAAALAHAHRNGITHGDVKPSNIFIRRDGRVLLLDFGAGGVTPAYASPEALDGQPPDPADDVYALACVARELLTGRHPFGRRESREARDAGLTPEPVSGIPRRIARAIDAALAFERAVRPPDAAAFLRAIRPRPALPFAVALMVALGAIAWLVWAAK